MCDRVDDQPDVPVSVRIITGSSNSAQLTAFVETKEAVNDCLFDFAMTYVGDLNDVTIITGTTSLVSWCHQH